MEEKNSDGKYLVDTVEEALDVMKKHELQHTLRFATFYTRKDFGSTGMAPFSIDGELA